MRTLVHLSDLHFGRTKPEVVAACREEVIATKPDVLVVSGDFTQRAKSAEFAEARDFLGGLPGEKVCVPGNHDIPLWNALARLFTPLRNYRRFISREMTPVYRDSEITVLGINTARSLTWKDGRVNREQIAAARKQLALGGPEMIRIVVTHHPFDLGETRSAHELVGRARMAMKELAACRRGCAARRAFPRELHGRHGPPVQDRRVFGTCGASRHSDLDPSARTRQFFQRAPDLAAARHGRNRDLASGDSAICGDRDETLRPGARSRLRARTVTRVTRIRRPRESRRRSRNNQVNRSAAREARKLCARLFQLPPR